MFHAKFQDPKPLGSGKVFAIYDIWARRPSWSCDLDYLYTLLISLPIETSYKVWL